MKQLLIYTYATGQYLHYADLWQYCIEHEYPEYGSKVFSGMEIGKAFHAPAVARYLIDPKEPGFDYYYITDIDMFIVREDPTLFEYHLKDMDDCFSNSRRGARERQGFDRVTGLHFYHYLWLEKTKDVRRKYFDMLLRGEIGHDAIDDEKMLAKIITEVNMELPAQKNLVSRHHGIHLGTVRGKQRLTIGERTNLMLRKINKEKALRWAEITGTKVYRKLYTKIQNVDRDAAWQLHEVERFCNQKANSK